MMHDTEQKTLKLLFTKKEAAAALSVSVRTLENYIRLKELVSRKIGKRRLIPRASLEQFARRDHESPANGHGQ
jgi:excisionase family DNA binding protein